ncbi:hypothetical protein ABV409_15140 [Flagellimonas sp. DF-77]|uniref:hypothetical protein n=1 Tax=Flagellimonas algarum TaxID=3230298 RepID=UPI0033990D01
MSGNLDDLINNIDFLDSEESKINEIERILKILDSSKIDKYQLFYLKGFLWNLMPVESDERDFEVENNLKKSITLNGDNIYSKTELSFFYFDKKKYEKVVELLKELDLSFFERNNQLWKSLKLQEILAVSELYILKSFDKEISDRFLELISSYSFLPEEELAVPRELVFGIYENREKSGVKSIFNNVYSMITNTGQREFFSDDIRKKFMILISEGYS